MVFCGFAELLKCSYANHSVTDRNAKRQSNNIDLYRSREENVQFWLFTRGPASTALCLFFYKVENLGLLSLASEERRKILNSRHYSLSLCLYLVVLFVESDHLCFISVTIRNIREYEDRSLGNLKCGFQLSLKEIA